MHVALVGRDLQRQWAHTRTRTGCAHADRASL